MFYVGQKVRCFKWNGGAPKVGDIGVVKYVHNNDMVSVDFPCQQDWAGGDYCVHPLEEEMDEEVYY